MQKITPCLWFDTQAEEAAKFYVSLLKDSRVGKITRYDNASAEVSGQPEGSVLTVEFRLEGQDFLALNGGPLFKFTEAISFIITCEDQAEVDRLWEKLTADGGEESQCGWLKDKYGVSWQIVPKGLDELISHPKAMQAMLKMKKLIIKDLQDAYNGK